MKPSSNSLFRGGTLGVLALLVGALYNCGGTEPPRALPTPATGLPPHAAYLAQSPSRLVVSAQSLVSPLAAGPADTISLTGYVAPDPRRERQVAARVGGRIERLYARYNYQYVTQGQKLLDLYSPELNTALAEYQYLLAQGSDADLIRRARTRLLLLGLSAAQLTSSGKGLVPTVPIVSPYAGYVVPGEGAAAAPMPAPGGMASGAGMGGDAGMGEGQALAAPAVLPAPATSLLREGDYVERGQPLLRINDLRQVWGLLAVEARYVARVRAGQRVLLRSELAPGQVLEGRVAYVEPALAPNQKLLQVRVYLPNPEGHLKINSLLTGTLEAPAPAGLQLPAASVYDLGRRRLVWVYRGPTAGGHRLFEARAVRTGPLGGPMVAIRGGLAPGEKVARNAGYLVDSESFIDLQP
ncbi:efflux RND transporter periplasmic adaptor subunit [Hymenobacter lutimineralis]|uniref:Efflux RND transporter periplasmic adaptor subunit n=1 Tax=Hymenobacter lutimineralis TaxID=2606448 RepID=A0A5D6UW86_9BACT|nr:efflux RND transporter periplasmic adaptor subunit [Hymenobacter lutimineralis]TYZ07245.1 efflux RND transporter periplasmic adaptor subunit [Hymenobacter lutimineralis]